MADTDTSTPTTPSPPPDLSGVPQDVLAQALQQLLGPQQPVVATSSPSTSDGRSVLSLLGEGLGGGAQYGTTSERETGGLAALGSFGQRLMAAGDYSYQPHTFGSMLAQGLGGARQSLADTQAVSAARQTAAQRSTSRSNRRPSLNASRRRCRCWASRRSRRPVSGHSRSDLAAIRNTAPGGSISTGGSIGQVTTFAAPSCCRSITPGEHQMARTGIPAGMC